MFQKYIHKKENEFNHPAHQSIHRPLKVHPKRNKLCPLFMKEMQTSRAPTSLYSPARLPLSKICNSDGASINAFRDKWPGVNPPINFFQLIKMADIRAI